MYCGIEATKIACEKVSDVDWDPSSNVSISTCYMHNFTRIEEDNVEILNVNDSIGALTFVGNVKIFYLPVKVAESFPNLFFYQAYSNAVRELSKKNFRKLSKLRALYLPYNQIETVRSDAFEDLVNLEIIWLGKIRNLSFRCFKIQ